VLPELEEKYDAKRSLINECDDLDGRLEDKIANIEKALQDHLAQVEKICDKINGASPIENPSKGPEKKGFVDTLSDQSERANELRGKLEALKDRLQAAKDKREADVQPLC
jgi:DNA repair exonuclease SbcCD ATPase subunit